MNRKDKSEGRSSGDADGESSGGVWKWRFWLVFAGQTLSLIGSSLTQFVLMWWITDTTGSIAALGVAGMAGLVPQAVLGPFAGVCADRYSRRMLMIVADVISALCMGVLIVLFHIGKIELIYIYVLMSIRSAAAAFQQPAAMASVPMLVPASFLATAVALNQALDGVLVIAGAPLGAFVMSLMPIDWALGIDVVTMLMGIFPLFFYSIPQKRPSEQSEGMWRQFREGVNTVWGDQALRRMFIVITLTVMVFMPLFTLIPMLIKEHFQGGADQVAYFESLAGAGMIAGSIFVSALKPRNYMPWIIIGICLAGSMISMSAGLQREMFWVSAVLWAIAAFGQVVGTALFMTLIQTIVENDIQGRVLSILNTMMGVAAPLGIALATPLGEIVGTRWLFVWLPVLGSMIMLSCFFSTSVMSLDARRFRKGK